MTVNQAVESDTLKMVGNSPEPQHIHDQLVAVEELEKLIEDKLKEAMHPEGDLIGPYIVQSLSCFGRCEPLHDINITCTSHAQENCFWGLMPV